MPDKVFNSPMSPEDCLNYIRPSNKTQRITSFITDQTVTLRNPQRVKNNTGSSCVISLRLDGEETFCPIGFNAYEQLVCDPAEVGNSTRGTTCTDVVIHGID